MCPAQTLVFHVFLNIRLVRLLSQTTFCVLICCLCVLVNELDTKMVTKGQVPLSPTALVVQLLDKTMNILL